MSPIAGWFDSVARWWRSDTPAAATAATPADQASDALRQLLEDTSVPESVRRELGDEFARIQSLLDKLARNELHVAVFGRVSVGKSALGNALLGTTAFETGVLHGTTTRAEQQRWTEAGGSGLHLIDTPGINELDGEARERLAFEVAEISDLVLFVVDGDMTQIERDALATLARTERPLLLVLNKADRYDDAERERLLTRLREHASGLLPAANVLSCAASPAPVRVIDTDASGNERERREPRDPDVSELRERLLAICAREMPVPSRLGPVPPGFDGWFARACARDVGRNSHANQTIATQVDQP